MAALRRRADHRLRPHLHAGLPPNARFAPSTCAASARPLRPAAHRSGLRGVARAFDCDVFFGANYFLPRLHGAVARRRVVTVHDLTYKRFPELLQKETLANLESQMMREVATADAIVCVSESTRKRPAPLLHDGPGPCRRHSLRPGCTIDGRAIEGLPSRYLLFVSTIEPRKNLGTLLDAYERMARARNVRRRARRRRKSGMEVGVALPRLRKPGVLHLDYLPAAQLATVYAKAEAFVFPSIYEGFGFPVLEAMSRASP